MLSRRARSTWRGRAFFLLLLVLACPATRNASMARAQEPPSGEHQLKAAFLYNFARFVEWPADVFPDSQSAVVIGVIGGDGLGETLAQAVAGKTVNGRPLVIRQCKRGQDLRNYHLLFISSSERKHLSQILESLKGASVLTVGETDRFARLGGAVNFLLEENKVRFEVNVAAVERARLKMSAKLLGLARIVADEPWAEKN